MQETSVEAATDSRGSAGEIEIRPATPDTLREITAPLALAFGETFSDAEFADWSRTLEVDRVLGAFEDDRAVASSGALTFGLTVPGGGEIGAAGITIVGVSPSHRRRGILRRMMRRLIDDAHERGEAVAVLWASEGAIYQRYGYGLATLNGTFEVERDKVAWLRPVEPLGRMRIVDRDEAVPLFGQVYDALRASIPGAISRSPEYWRWAILNDAEYMQREHGPKVRVVLEVDGQPQGYAVYRIKAEWDERGPKSQVLAYDVAGLSLEAERAVWDWLFQLDLVRTVRAWHQPVPHPLQLQVAEPRRLGLIVGDGIWLRIVDLPAALEARTYSAAGELVLGVTDEFCPWNDAAWRVSVGAPGRRPTVSRSESAPDVALTAADLGALYLGAFRFADLARVGRVSEVRPGALADADRMFTTDRAPWCSTGF